MAGKQVVALEEEKHSLLCFAVVYLIWTDLNFYCSPVIQQFPVYCSIW